MVIFLYGEDTFRSRQQMQAMVDKFKADRDPEGLNVIKLDVEKTEPSSLWHEILAVPFLAEKRMVVLEQALTANKPDFQKGFLERLEENTLPESTVVIVWEPAEKWRRKLSKELFSRLEKEKFCQHFPLLDGTKLTAWVAKEIEDRGAKADRHAVSFLAQHADDMWQVDGLIDQLIAYTDGKEIGLADVQLFLSDKVDDNIFNLVDAIVNKQSNVVYDMIYEQYRNGKESFYIFAMLVRQFRILLQIRDAFDRGMHDAKILAKALGLHPYVLKKSMPQAKKYDLNTLKTIHRQLLIIDIKIKTSRQDHAQLVDIFVGRLFV